MPEKRKPSVSKEKNETHHKEVEALYNQLNSLFKKTGLSKTVLASKISMSYQGFLHSYKNKRLSLDKLIEISRFINIPLNVKFEKELTPNTSPVPNENEKKEPSKEHAVELESAKEKIALLEKQNSLLESRIADKDVIIGLLSRN